MLSIIDDRKVPMDNDLLLLRQTQQFELNKKKVDNWIRKEYFLVEQLHVYEAVGKILVEVLMGGDIGTLEQHLKTKEIDT